MRRYDGLFILDLAGKEDSVDGVIQQITTLVEEEEGRVDKIEKMEQRAFARVANKRHRGGHYVSICFGVSAAGLAELRPKLAAHPAVFRTLIERRPDKKEAA